MEAAATPFPREETTPPVTKIYFGPIRTGFAPQKASRPAKLFLFLQGSRRTTHSTENVARCQFIGPLGLNSWKNYFLVP